MLTPEKIEAWRIDFIRRTATDPPKEKSARVSANSFILRARALFGPATVARVRDIVENFQSNPLPFGEGREGPRFPLPGQPSRTGSRLGGDEACGHASAFQVAESMGFTGDFRQWEQLLRVGD